MSSSDQTNTIASVARPKSSFFNLTWKIKNFASCYRETDDFLFSREFTCGGVKCQLCVFRFREFEPKNRLKIAFLIHVNEIENNGPCCMSFRIYLNHILRDIFKRRVLNLANIPVIAFIRSTVFYAKSCVDTTGALRVLCNFEIWRDVAATDVDRKTCKKNWEGNVPVPPTLEVDCSSSMGADFLASYENRQFCDVVLNVAGEEFHAHKAILTARSSVFAAVFSSNIEESSPNAVKIPGTRAPIFKILLIFMYSGKLSKVPACDVLELCDAAEKYNIKELKSTCEKFLFPRLSTSNFATVAELAFLHSDEDFMNSIVEFIGGNFRKIIETREWKAFEEQQPDTYREVMKLLVLKKIEK